MKLLQWQETKKNKQEDGKNRQDTNKRDNISVRDDKRLAAEKKVRKSVG